LEPYRVEAIVPRLEQILREINTFFDLVPTYRTPIADLTPWRLQQLRLQTGWQKVQRKFSKKTTQIP
jgi:hypothetical protein